MEDWNVSVSWRLAIVKSSSENSRKKYLAAADAKACDDKKSLIKINCVVSANKESVNCVISR